MIDFNSGIQKNNERHHILIQVLFCAIFVFLQS